MAKKKVYFYIYKIVHNKSKRYYYGMHKTKNLKDGYFGSGKKIKKAVEKYGKEAFTKTIVEYCSSSREMAAREKQIITGAMVRDPKCYNMKPGGKGGFMNKRKSKAARVFGKRKKNWKRTIKS